jgi:hypothetical protein
MPDMIIAMVFEKPLNNINSLFEKDQDVDRKEQVAGYTAYIVKEENAGEMWVIPINDTIIVTGTEAFVKKAAELSKGTGEGIAKNSEVMELCDSGKAGNMFWAAGAIPEEIKNMAKGRPNLPVKIEEIKGYFVGADYDAVKGLAVACKLNCASDQAAQTLKTTLDTISADAAKVGIGKDAIKIEQSGAAVNINVTISSEMFKGMTAQLDGLLKNAMSGSGTMPNPGTMPSPMPMPMPRQ